MNKRKAVGSTPAKISSSAKKPKQKSIHAFFGGGSAFQKEKTTKIKGFHTAVAIKKTHVKTTSEIVSLSSDEEEDEIKTKIEKKPTSKSNIKNTSENARLIYGKARKLEKNEVCDLNIDDEICYSPISEFESGCQDKTLEASIRTDSPSCHKKTEITLNTESDLANKKRDAKSLILKPQPMVASHAKKVKQCRFSNDMSGIENGMKKCPFFKRIPNTNFVVDAFSYGRIDKISAYFLSHFHYDHYMGLNKNFTGKVYCNEITAKLCKLKLGLPEHKLVVLPMNTLTAVNGIEVLLLDANHCPGSCMFLFFLSDFEIYLHTGDFRASESCSELWTNLEPYRTRMATLFLDTTYLNPTYAFPSQVEIVNKVAELVLSLVEKRGKNNILFVFGSYTIGKERLFLKVAEVLDAKISVDKPKFDILNCFDWPEISQRVELRSKLAMIVVKPMQEIKVQNLRYLSTKLTGSRRFSHVVGFIPTGWSQSKGFSLEDSLHPSSEQGNISIYSVPYSEHSSFEELKQFVQFLKPKEVIPTVGHNYKEMQNYIQSWLKD